MENNIEEKKEYVNTLIISDIHLGSEVARPQHANEMLKKYYFKRLILLGDIFDDLNFKRLNKEHWNLLSHIRKLSNPKRKIDVIWIEGNHDEGLIEIMSHLIGINVLNEYKWRINGKKFLAIHGHQFDRFLNENIVISAIASFFYKIIQKIGKEKQRVARFVKNTSKGWLRLSKKIADNATAYARHKQVDVIICGHTHKAIKEYFEDRKIEYLNTGCWTDIPSSFLVIDDEGNSEIKYY